MSDGRGRLNSTREREGAIVIQMSSSRDTGGREEVSVFCSFLLRVLAHVRSLPLLESTRLSQARQTVVKYLAMSPDALNISSINLLFINLSNVGSF